MKELILSFVASILMTACGKQGDVVAAAVGNKLPTKILSEDTTACDSVRAWDQTTENISVTVHNGWLMFSPGAIYSTNLLGKTRKISDEVISMKDCDVTVAASKVVSVVDVVVTPPPPSSGGCNWWTGQGCGSSGSQPPPNYGGGYPPPGYGAFPPPGYGH